MQQQNDAALAAAILATDRTPVQNVNVTWGMADYSFDDVTPVVEEWQVTRSITGDLPTSVGLVEGYESAEMTMTVSGSWYNGESVARSLLGFAQGGALASAAKLGSYVMAKVGFAGTLVQVFAGRLRSMRGLSSTRSVTITCLDEASRFSVPAGLPVWAVADSIQQWGSEGGAFRVNTQWVVDHLFRRAGYFPSPPIAPGALFSASFHGGLCPNLGTEGVQNPIGMTWTTPWDANAFNVPAPWGMLAPIPHFPSSVRYRAVAPRDGDYYATAFGTNQSQGLGMCARISIGTVSSQFFGRQRLITFSGRRADGLPSGGISLNTLRGSTNGVPDQTVTLCCEIIGADGAGVTIDGPVVVASATWQYVGMHVKYTTQTSVTVTFRYGYTSYTVTGTVPSAPSSDPSVYVDINLNIAPLVDVNCWSNPDLPVTWPAESFTPNVVVDVGLNELWGLPIDTTISARDALRSLTKAESAVFSVDEQGKPSWRNRDTMARLAQYAPVRTFTADRSLMDLGIERNIDTVRNVISVAATPMVLSSEYVTVWSLSNIGAMVCSPQSSLLFTVPIDPSVFLVDAPVLIIPGVNWSAVNPQNVPSPSLIGTGSRVSLWTAGAEASSGVSILITRDSPTTLLVNVFNQLTTEVILSNNGQQPAFIITGLRVAAGNTDSRTVRDGPSKAAYGERYLQVTPSTWHQHLPSLTGILSALIARTKAPVAVLEQIPVVGDPRIQLADVVTIVDPDGMGSLTGSVVRVDHGVSAQKGMYTVLTVRA